MDITSVCLVNVIIFSFRTSVAFQVVVLPHPRNFEVVSQPVSHDRVISLSIVMDLVAGDHDSSVVVFIGKVNTQLCKTKLLRATDVETSDITMDCDNKFFIMCLRRGIS